MVHHMCNTCGGMSGSPLWSYNLSTGKRTICAVHKADAIETSSGLDNLAVPLFYEALTWIDSVISKHKL